MTNLLQDGVTWLGTRLKAVAGLSVTYARGSDSVAVTASAAFHEYQIVDEEGFSASVLVRDYLLHAADLIIDGSVITPRAGDTITETINGVSQTFEVMPLDERRREYEPLDTDGVLLKLHTKRVA